MKLTEPNEVFDQQIAAFSVISHTGFNVNQDADNKA